MSYLKTFAAMEFLIGILCCLGVRAAMAASAANTLVTVSCNAPRAQVVVNGNDFDVFAPGYIDSFVTNVMVTANGGWELVEPTALPLRMKGGDTATYKVICPPECKDGGTIAFHNYYISSDRDGGLKDIVVEAGASVTYTAHKNGSLCDSDWTVNGETETDTSSIVFNRNWWDVSSWFIPSMDTPKPGVYNINAHDVQHTVLNDSGSMTVVGVKRISGPNGKASERAEASTGGVTWSETEVIYAQPCAVFDLTAELEMGLSAAEVDKIKDSIEWSADSGRITPDENDPLVAEYCAPDDEGAYEIEVSCGESRRIILVKVGVLKIHQVSFLGNIAIKRDETGVVYADPAWKDDDLDGVSDLTDANADAGKFYQPVAYLSTKRLSAEGVFLPVCAKVSNPDEYISSFDAEAAVQKLRFAPNNRLFGWDWSTPVAFNKNGTQVTAASPFRSSAEVGYESEYELAWEVGFGEHGTADDGLSWHRSRSQHELYLTYKAEYSSYETVFHISCTKSTGRTSEPSIADAIWSVFAGLNVRRKGDNTQFKYWNPAISTIPQHLSLMLQNTNANGSCLAWSEFLIHTLDVQFISSSRVFEIKPKAKTANGFLVKSWKFGLHIQSGANGVIDSAVRNDDILYENVILPGPNGMLDSFPLNDDVVVDGLVHGMEYPYVMGFDVCDQAGVSGQGNSNPPGAFLNHFIVQYAGRFYDPSYGTGPYANELAHENASIDGVYSDSSFAKKKGVGPELIYTP